MVFQLILPPPPPPLRLANVHVASLSPSRAWKLRHQLLAIAITLILATVYIISYNRVIGFCMTVLMLHPFTQKHVASASVKAIGGDWWFILILKKRERFQHWLPLVAQFQSAGERKRGTGVTLLLMFLPKVQPTDERRKRSAISGRKVNPLPQCN